MKVNVHPILEMFRQILIPVVASGTFALLAFIYHIPFDPEYMLLDAIIFLLVPYWLSNIHTESEGNYFFGVRVFLWFFLRWIAILFSLEFIVNLTEHQDKFNQIFLRNWAIVTPFAILVCYNIMQYGCHYFFSKATIYDKAVIVGVSQLSIKLAKNLRKENSGIQNIGFFDDRVQTRLPESFELLGKIPDVYQFVVDNQIKIVYITISITEQSRIHFLLDQLRDTTVSIYYLPDVFVSDMIQSRFFTAEGIPMVSLCESPFIGINALIKRCSDVTLSCIILLLISPLLLLIALGVKLTSPGPILFKQTRYGLWGEEIMVYKFRSMTVCEEGNDVIQATRNDSRITPFGAFLRRQSLDELPQFINVVEGKMSIVGPRPHAVSHNEFYRKHIKGYMVRHKVKPGITGWAQVNGCRGETDTIDKMQARIEYDLDYLRHWSISLDLWIILRTIGIVIVDKNAY